ncbi:MAG: exo-alpha-sialidase [Nitrospira sp.]
MSRIRVLVGTRKGAFILAADGKRKRWEVQGPHFGGWELYHLKGSPVDPNRLYASQTSNWFGQVIQRSDDGGKTWNPPGTKPEDFMGEDGMPKGESNMFLYDSTAETGRPLTTHQHYDGSHRPWEFKRVWHLEPSLTDPDTVYAGVEDAAIFKSTEGGKTWQELAGLRNAKGHLWQPGAGGMCLHTILLDKRRLDRIFVAISAAGTFRTDDAGKAWRPTNKGLVSKYELPDPDAEVGHCVHSITMHPSRPNVLFMQKHWDVLRSDNAGESWHEISGNLPNDFGFPIAVHAHEPNTIYVVPIKSDSEHYRQMGNCVCTEAVSGVTSGSRSRSGLPQEHCYVNILRDAMSVDPPPDAVVKGIEPLLIVGAMAGG